MTVLIRCQNLCKSYGATKALDDVSFEISAGNPVALVGPNGAGKSTLFSILCGYQNASAGDVEIFGETPIAATLSGKLGALPQDALFDPDLTLLEQLVFFARLQGFDRKAANHECLRVLELMGLKDKQNTLPTALSHGMRKRLSIAQALIGSPQLVLLDEPTAGLDPENARNIREVIRDLSDQTTFVISSHNLNELERLCNQVLFLEQGRLRLDQNIEQQAQGNITLRLWQENHQIITAIGQLSGVQQVSAKHEEIFIDYDAALNPIVDQHLLQLLAEHQLGYRQLSHGRSLEQQLFS
ncbi:MAG: ABC transporter ATP-binding protein [Saccharospirillaceae bacterium]|nr:ABC transporter [Thalassolituus sp. HI0120]MCH2040899.1 ABC transporter ATP-binding protein [Saccharospirillaceae bacterium]